jgi:hypothetical protein
MKTSLLISLGLLALLLCSCSNNPKTKLKQKDETTSAIIQFPVEAKQKNIGVFEDDTLIANVNAKAFLITPEGKLFWGDNPADTIHLLTDEYVEKAFLYLRDSILYIFYTATDHEGATSRLEKINIKSKQRLMKAEIQGVNLGVPYIINDYAYVTTVGVVGKLNLDDGKYVYQYFGLYDYEKQSFNSFDTIIFKNDSTFFLSKNINSKRIDSLIVNEKSGTRIIKK